MAKSPEVEHPNKAFGSARDTSGLLSPFNFSRRAIGEKDVTVKVLFCGICHSDLHMVKNEWGKSTYPFIPGKEGGSCIGGMKETQEMIDFVAKHNITADIEVIPIDYVNTAMERLVKANVRH